LLLYFYKVQSHLFLILITFLDGPNIISRAQWGARAPKSGISNLKLKPAPYVIIHHSTGSGCETQALCQLKIRQFQVFNIRKQNFFLNSKFFLLLIFLTA